MLMNIMKQMNIDDASIYKLDGFWLENLALSMDYLLVHIF